MGLESVRHWIRVASSGGLRYQVVLTNLGCAEIWFVGWLVTYLQERNRTL
jgi:hypothetical protein